MKISSSTPWRRGSLLRAVAINNLTGHGTATKLRRLSFIIRSGRRQTSPIAILPLPYFSYKKQSYDTYEEVLFRRD
jgi:hypothetical protein